MPPSESVGLKVEIKVASRGSFSQQQLTFASHRHSLDFRSVL